MAISSTVSRFADYYRRNGFGATIRRVAVAAKRSLFSSRSVLFYCDLGTQTATPRDLPKFLTMERKRSSTELSAEDLEALTSVWSPRLVQQNIKERFARGASLWLINSHDKLAGYGWTLQGTTVEPHYFLLGRNDFHLFDFHVFPQFRGQGMNPALVTEILHRLANNGDGRAFIEAAEWNLPQLSSLTKTPFCRLGVARKWTFFGQTVVYWSKTDSQSSKKGH